MIRMSNFCENVIFNKMADFFIDEMREKRKSEKEHFKQLVTDGATQKIADTFHLSYQEAEDALVVLHSRHARLCDMKFPVTTAGLRKLANYRTGVIDCMGENVVQCIESPSYFVDWVYQKMNPTEPFVEFGKIANNLKWKRCESTGLWFYDKKPPLRCDIELCTACTGFFPVFESIREIRIKFFYWDSKVKSFDNYMTFYDKFLDTAEKNAIVLDFKSKEVKYMYYLRIFRFMAAKRYAVGDIQFRYSLSESYVKDYVDIHHKTMLDQLADLPLDQATQVVNTCLNDTIVMATEEEVSKWLKDYLNNSNFLDGPMSSLSPVVDEDELPLSVKLEQRKTGLGAPFILRNHVELHGNDPSSVRFCSIVAVHADIPVGSRVSRIRLLEYLKERQNANMLALDDHKDKFLYVFTKADWYLPIPAFVRIESAGQLEEIWEDGEEEDGCYIRLLHDFSKKNDATGEVVEHKEGNEIFVLLEQMDNIDDYPWEIFNNDREMQVYCFRVKVGEMLRAARNQKRDQIPDDQIRVEIYKEFGSWQGQNMDKTIAMEIFDTPWEELVHTKPSEYKW